MSDFTVKRGERPRMQGTWHGTRSVRVLLIALALAALGGCNLLRFGYGHLDNYALWQADDYFDLDPQQRQEFRERFARLHDWHRREQLPDYAALLGAIKARAQRGLAREDVLWITDNVRARYRAVAERAAPEAAAMLLKVTPAQLEHLQRQWEKDNRAFVREYRLEASAEAQRRAATDRALSRVREWTGALSAEQEEKVAALAAMVPMNHRLRHEDRLRRQREFLQLMGQRGDPARFAERLRHWLVNWEEGRDPAYDRLWAQWTQRQADFYVAVDGLLTPEQRVAVARRLDRYAQDFTQLAQRPAPQAASR
jgi:hypothetical protein